MAGLYGLPVGHRGSHGDGQARAPGSVIASLIPAARPRRAAGRLGAGSGLLSPGFPAPLPASQPRLGQRLESEIGAARPYSHCLLISKPLPVARRRGGRAGRRARPAAGAEEWPPLHFFRFFSHSMFLRNAMRSILPVSVMIHESIKGCCIPSQSKPHRKSCRL